MDNDDGDNTDQTPKKAKKAVKKATPEKNTEEKPQKNPKKKSTKPPPSPFELQTLIDDLGLPRLSEDHTVRSKTSEQHGCELTQIRGNGAVVQVTRKAFGDNFEAAGNVLISACRSGYCKEDMEKMKKEMLKTSKGG